MKVEIFTANCPVCDPVVKMVNELACENCEIITYDLIKQCENKTCLNKLEEYSINKVPAIALNGKLLECCQNDKITKENLINAGIGQG
ncbi:MAG: thioredoxin family protein [Candidatus Cyclobacteriaceae bacterium M2_1C_046]